MFCQKCGTENTDTSKFCVRCGNRLTPAIASNPPPIPAVPAGLASAEKTQAVASPGPDGVWGGRVNWSASIGGPKNIWCYITLGTQIDSLHRIPIFGWSKEEAWPPRLGPESGNRLEGHYTPQTGAVIFVVHDRGPLGIVVRNHFEGKLVDSHAIDGNSSARMVVLHRATFELHRLSPDLPRDHRE